MFAPERVDASRARYLNAYWNRFDLGSKRLQRHRDEVIVLYDSGVRWVDAQISRLVEMLRESKLWGNCIFAVTSDHGEEFLEHGRRYHAPALVEELIHVPLMIRVPGLQNKNLSSDAFSLLHLAPTLLAAAELPIPAEFQGQDYWEHLQKGTGWGDPAISECIAGCTNPFRPEQRRGARLVAVRENRYKLLLNLHTGNDYLFDLEADPGEQTPLPKSVARPDRRRLLEIALAHLRKSIARNSEAYLLLRLREIGLDLATSTSTDARIAG